MSRKLAVQATTANVLLLGLNVVNGALLARWLGPTGRGELAAVMLLPALLIVVGSLGLGTATVYFSSAPSRSSTVFGTVQSLGAIQSLILIPVGYFLAPLLFGGYGDSLVSLARWYLLVIPMGLWCLYSVSILAGELWIPMVNLLNGIMPSGYLASTLLLAATARLTTPNIILAQLLLNVLVTAAATIAVARRRSVLLRLDVALARRLLAYGGKTQLGTVSQNLNLRLDQALVAAFLPARQLGLYVAAVNSVSLLHAVSSAGRAIFLPRVVAVADNEAHTEQVSSMFRQYVIVLLSGAAILATALPVAIPLVFGLEYTDSLAPAYFLLLASIIYGSKDVLSAILQGLNSPWHSSRAELFALVVTALGLIILVPRLGLLGTAFVSILAYTTSLVVMSLALTRSHGFDSSQLFVLQVADAKSAIGPSIHRIASVFNRKFGQWTSKSS